MHHTNPELNEFHTPHKQTPPLPPPQTHPKDSDEQEGPKLKEVPLVAVVCVEENQVAGEVRIHQLKGEGSRQGSKESSPHHLVGKVVGHLQESGH